MRLYYGGLNNYLYYLGGVLIIVIVQWAPPYSSYCGPYIKASGPRRPPTARRAQEHCFATARAGAEGGPICREVHKQPNPEALNPKP